MACCVHPSDEGSHGENRFCRIHIPASIVHALSSNQQAQQGLDGLALKWLQPTQQTNLKDGLGMQKSLFSLQP